VTDELTWQDPPPDRRRQGSAYIDAIAEQLKSNPGKWALIRTVKSTGSSSSTFRKRGLEVTLRRRPDLQFDLYARWPEEKAS
jgi:hypothetical protein